MSSFYHYDSDEDDQFVDVSTFFDSATSFDSAASDNDRGSFASLSAAAEVTNSAALATVPLGKSISFDQDVAILDPHGSVCGHVPLAKHDGYHGSYHNSYQSLQEMQHHDFSSRSLNLNDLVDDDDDSDSLTSDGSSVRREEGRGGLGGAGLVLTTAFDWMMGRAFGSDAEDAVNDARNAAVAGVDPGTTFSAPSLQGSNQSFLSFQSSQTSLMNGAGGAGAGAESSGAATGANGTLSAAQ